MRQEIILDLVFLCGCAGSALGIPGKAMEWQNRRKDGCNKNEIPDREIFNAYCRRGAGVKINAGKVGEVTTG